MDAAVFLELLYDKGCVLYGGLKVILAAYDTGGEREGAEHEAFPGRQDLLVASRPDTFLTHGEELRPDPCDTGPQFFRREPELVGDGLGRAGDVQDVLTLEVAPLGHVPVARRKARFVRVQGGLQLFERPDVELPLLALGVGVLGGVETPFLARHVAQDVVKRLLWPGTSRGRASRGGRYRRASSRSAGRASSRPRSSGRSLHRAGRRCRLSPSAGT